MALADLLYVAYFAAIGPLIDYWILWPAHSRRAQADPTRARVRLWAWSMSAWVVVAVGVALWMGYGRSWEDFGFSLPDGWRSWTFIALVVLLAAYYALGARSIVRNAETRASVRQQAETVAALMPHTRREMYWWTGVSLTAGFCEEFLFRGYFIWVFAAWLGWWGAAALSLLIFAGWHAYQGWYGVLRTGIFGAIYTLAVAAFDSLWPAIALHALTDIGSGAMAWLALREPEPTIQNCALPIEN
ncbi:MAG TPA: CPBP family intramembrane glutamic endopeptidase [Vicinamibacterales bacterium]|nr:CPBP family intramembrane glutamic endopeptidase [Vicinamibacterales bacterium]